MHPTGIEHLLEIVLVYSKPNRLRICSDVHPHGCVLDILTRPLHGTDASAAAFLEAIIEGVSWPFAR